MDYSDPGRCWPRNTGSRLEDSKFNIKRRVRLISTVCNGSFAYVVSPVFHVEFQSAGGSPSWWKPGGCWPATGSKVKTMNLHTREMVLLVFHFLQRRLSRVRSLRVIEPVAFEIHFKTKPLPSPPVLPTAVNQIKRWFIWILTSWYDGIGKWHRAVLQDAPHNEVNTRLINLM